MFNSRARGSAAEADDQDEDGDEWSNSFCLIQVRWSGVHKFPSFATYVDISRITGMDGTSQGGYTKFVTAPSAAESRASVGWVVQFSFSCSRASLGVVAEACVIAVNAREFAALFMLEIFCRLSLCRTKACLEKLV